MLKLLKLHPLVTYYTPRLLLIKKLHFVQLLISIEVFDDEESQIFW